MAVSMARPVLIHVRLFVSETARDTSHFFLAFTFLKNEFGKREMIQLFTGH